MSKEQIARRPLIEPEPKLEEPFGEDGCWLHQIYGGLACMGAPGNIAWYGEGDDGVDAQYDEIATEFGFDSFGDLQAAAKKYQRGCRTAHILIAALLSVESDEARDALVGLIDYHVG